MFQESFNFFSSYFEINPIFLENENEVIFLNDEFRKIIIKKLGHMVSTIKENMGDIIVWSDCDILCINNPYCDIINNTKNVDICGFREHKRETYMNFGFLSIKCSEKTHLFFLEILNQAIVDVTEKRHLYFEQDIFNLCKKDEKYGITYNFYPFSDFFLFYKQRLNHITNINQLMNKKILHLSGIPKDHVCEEIMEAILKKIKFRYIIEKNTKIRNLTI